MNDSERDVLEKKIAILGQSVASVLAEIRLELLAVRSVLIDRKMIEPQDVTEKAKSLRDSQIPKLTAETSGDLRVRFERLCDQAEVE